MVLLAAGVRRTLGRRDAEDAFIDLRGPDARAGDSETVARSSGGATTTEGMESYVETVR